MSSPSTFVLSLVWSWILSAFVAAIPVAKQMCGCAEAERPSSTRRSGRFPLRLLARPHGPPEALPCRPSRKPSFPPHSSSHACPLSTTTPRPLSLSRPPAIALDGVGQSGTHSSSTLDSGTTITVSPEDWKKIRTTPLHHGEATWVVNSADISHTAAKPCVYR